MTNKNTVEVGATTYKVSGKLTEQNGYGWRTLGGVELLTLADRAREQLGVELAEAFWPTGVCSDSPQPKLDGKPMDDVICRFNDYRPFTRPLVEFGLKCNAYTTDEQNSYSTPGSYRQGHVVSDFAVLISKTGKKYYHFDGVVVATWAKHPAHETVHYARKQGGYYCFMDCGVMRKIGGDVVPPTGFRFAFDREGLKVVRQSDDMDHHVASASNINWEYVRSQMDLNKARRDMDLCFAEADTSTTLVTLEDSRRAGNCVEGSLRFAESRLGLSRADILAGGYLFAVAAPKLLATHDERAARAVKLAWLRETTPSI